MPSRASARGGQASRFIVLATQMLPPVAIVLPVLRSSGSRPDQLGPGLMIAYAGSIAVPDLDPDGLLRGVPVELEWAAMTDGATAWGAFWRIVIPVSLPGLAAAGVLGIHPGLERFPVCSGADRPTTATIPVALSGCKSQNGVQIAEVSAGVVLGVAPVADRLTADPALLVSGLTFARSSKEH